jgi:catecholate siderophore receptor
MQKKTARAARNKNEKTTALIALGAVGLVGYTAAAGPAVVPAQAGQTRLPAAAAASAWTQTAAVHRFDIAEGTLGDAVKAVQTISGLRITFGKSGLDMIPTPAVRGDYTTERALQLLLAGTGIAYRYTAAEAVSLDLQTLSTAIDVSTSAPGTVVASTRYTETLRDIPQTIEVIPQAILQEQGAVTLSDALRNVPGITLQAGEGGGASNTTGDMFNLRGFNASNSIFVDGVRDDGLMSRNVFNLEQVEVYLGPTGSDVGRGTASGYVNMQTKTPSLRQGFSGSFSYDAADQKRGTVDFNQPVRLGPAGSWLARAAARLNALWQEGGVPGRDIVRLKNRAIAPAVTVGLGTPTRFTFQSQITRQDNLPDYGIPTAAWAPEALGPTTVRTLQPVEQSNYYGSLEFDYDRIAQENFTARVEHDINDNLTLRYQTRFNQTHRDAIITGIGAFNAANETVTLQRAGNDRKNRILSNQANAVLRFSTGTLRHAMSGGLEFAYEDQMAPTIGGVGTRGPIDIYNPDPRETVAGYAPAPTGAYNKGWTNTAAAYLFDTIDIANRWQLTGGMRFEQFTTNFRAVSNTLQTTTEERASDGLVSGKIGITYRINERANTYFSYGTSLTPPGTANFTLSAQANNQNNPNVEPQKSENYEVGAKVDFFRNRLLVNAAVFHTTNENVIFTVDATAVPPIFNQDDAQRVNGITVGGIGQITDRLQLIANIAYLDSELRSQNSANNGNRLVLTPRVAGSLWATYRTAFRLSLGGGLRHTDTVFVNAANSIRVPGYHVADAFAEYAVNENFTLRLNVYNLTGESYVSSVNNNGNRYNPGSPRSAMVTTSFRF